MLPKHLINTVPSCHPSQLDSLVENKTTFAFDNCALHIFETQQQAWDVQLKLDHFSLTSMISGKKIMRLGEDNGFDYLPGESVLVAPGQTMHIDFPEASSETPTQCLALEISNEFIADTLGLLNENFPTHEVTDPWQIRSQQFHLFNNPALSDTINRLLKVSLDEKGKAKDMLVNLTVQELMVRLMQSQSREFLEQNFKQLSHTNPFAHVIEYIHQHLDQPLNPDLLAEKACMSRTKFFLKFKECLGLTPIQYIMQCRLDAARKQLERTDTTVTQVCFACGFENTSHFSRLFKQVYGVSPKGYQKRYKRK